jgi:hypothetical protein
MALDEGVECALRRELKAATCRRRSELPNLNEAVSEPVAELCPNPSPTTARGPNGAPGFPGARHPPSLPLRSAARALAKAERDERLRAYCLCSEVARCDDEAEARGRTPEPCVKRDESAS